MADFIDNAVEVDEQFIEAAVKAISMRPRRHMVHTGQCYNPHCCLDVEAPKLFCDATCSSEYERIKRQRALNQRG